MVTGQQPVLPKLLGHLGPEPQCEVQDSLSRLRKLGVEVKTEEPIHPERVVKVFLCGSNIPSILETKMVYGPKV